MALLWLDGFDKYTAVANLTALTGWYSALTTSGSILPTGGATGGGALGLAGTGKRLTTKTLAGSIPSGNGVHIAAILKFGTTLDTNNGSLFTISTDVITASTSGSSPGLRVNSDGSLYITPHGSETVLATSALGVVTLGTYYWIEYAAKYNTAINGGFIKVWVNGNLVINFAGDTRTGTVPSTYTLAQIGSDFGAQTIDVDDFICWDENGTDFAYTQLSTSHLPIIGTLNPNADDSVQFTRLSGSNNYEMVDDASYQDSDTSYNYSSTIGHVDLFGLSDLPSSPSAFFGVGVKTVGKMSVAAIINVRTRLDSGGTIVDSADRLLSVPYAQFLDVYGKDPNGTVAWTEAAINALKTGYKYHS